MRRAPRPARAFDPDRRRSRPRDADAHALKKLAHLHDVRLGRGMTNLGDALDHRRREHGGFGAGDRRFVEIHRRGAKAVAALPARVPIDGSTRRTEIHERVDMRADRAPRGKIAARHAENRAAGPRQQRAEQQHRAAKLSHQLLARLRGLDFAQRTRIVVVPSP